MKDDWNVVADTVVGILDMTYVQERGRFEAEAARRGITLEQLVAAAITEATREVLEKKWPPPRPSKRTARR